MVEKTMKAQSVVSQPYYFPKLDVSCRKRRITSVGHIRHVCIYSAAAAAAAARTRVKRAVLALHIPHKTLLHCR